MSQPPDEQITQRDKAFRMAGEAATQQLVRLKEIAMKRAQTDERTTVERALLDEIFKLDAQYQGGIIKAKNRIDFIDTYLCPLIRKAMQHVPT